MIHNRRRAGLLQAILSWTIAELRTKIPNLPESTNTSALTFFAQTVEI